MKPNEAHVVKLVVTVQMRCFSCGATFTDSELGAAKQHVLSGGPKPLVDVAKGDPSYPCPDCGKVFQTEGWLVRHRNKEHGVKL